MEMVQVAFNLLPRFSSLSTILRAVLLWEEEHAFLLDGPKYRAARIVCVHLD